MSDNTALLAGFTREIYADTDTATHHLFVKPGDYLDGSFRAYDADEGEFILVAGWNVTIEDIAQH